MSEPSTQARPGVARGQEAHASGSRGAVPRAAGPAAAAASAPRDFEQENPIQATLNNMLLMLVIEASTMANSVSRVGVILGIAKGRAETATREETWIAIEEAVRCLNAAAHAYQVCKEITMRLRNRFVEEYPGVIEVMNYDLRNASVDTNNDREHTRVVVEQYREQLRRNPPSVDVQQEAELITDIMIGCVDAAQKIMALRDAIYVPRRAVAVNNESSQATALSGLEQANRIASTSLSWSTELFHTALSYNSLIHRIARDNIRREAEENRQPDPVVRHANASLGGIGDLGGRPKHKNAPLKDIEDKLEKIRSATRVGKDPDFVLLKDPPGAQKSVFGASGTLGKVEKKHPDGLDVKVLRDNGLITNVPAVEAEPLKFEKAYEVCDIYKNKKDGSSLFWNGEAFVPKDACDWRRNRAPAVKIDANLDVKNVSRASLVDLAVIADAPLREENTKRLFDTKKKLFDSTLKKIRSNLVRDGKNAIDRNNIYSAAIDKMYKEAEKSSRRKKAQDVVQTVNQAREFAKPKVDALKKDLECLEKHTGSDWPKACGMSGYTVTEHINDVQGNLGNVMKGILQKYK